MDARSCPGNLTAIAPIRASTAAAACQMTALLMLTRPATRASRRIIRWCSRARVRTAPRAAARSSLVRTSAASANSGLADRSSRLRPQLRPRVPDRCHAARSTVLRRCSVPVRCRPRRFRRAHVQRWDLADAPGSEQSATRIRRAGRIRARQCQGLRRLASRARGPTDRHPDPLRTQPWPRPARAPVLPTGVLYANRVNASDVQRNPRRGDF